MAKRRTPKLDLERELDNPVIKYLQELADQLPLPQNELEELLRGTREGDVTAKKNLVKSHLKLVLAVAKAFTGQGVPFLDLIQEGNMGLLRAADTFGPAIGQPFHIYVTWWIQHSIKRAIVEQRELRTKGSSPSDTPRN